MTRNRWVLVAIALVFPGILLVLFLWREHLSFSGAINDQKITNFFLIIAAATASVGLFYLAGQVREQRRTRLSNVLPVIYPNDAHFGLSNEQTEVNGRWIYQPSPSALVGARAPLFSITNIGVGAAKEIETQWVYDRDAVDQLAAGHYSFFSPRGNGNETKLNMLMAGVGAPIRLPLYYLICCGGDLNLDSGNPVSDGIFGVKPPLQFKVKYRDIYDQVFTQVFDVDVQAFGDKVNFKFGAPA